MQLTRAIIGVFIVSCLLVLISTESIMLKSQSMPLLCVTNTDCLPGDFCLNSLCTDKCLSMRCTAGTICKEGVCNPICTPDGQCPSGLGCNGEYCVDKCNLIKCPSNANCVRGKCLPSIKECLTDRQCKKGFYCSVDGTCEDTCLISNPCRKTQTCLVGKCLPVQLISPTCPKSIQCTNPRPTENQCSTRVWIREPDPVACGVTWDGVLIDFPLECYACKNSEIIKYYQKPCSEIPQNCANPLLKDPPVCHSSEILVEGKCVPKPAQPAKINCLDLRPDEKTCPTLNFIRASDSLVCGVDRRGNYIDFPVECYACKQKDIIYYFNTTCENVKKVSCQTVQCKQNSVCMSGVCVPNRWPVCKEKARTLQCKKTRPNEENCPVLQFFAIPPNIVCGVTSTGQHISYPVECYACKNTDVVYYYNQSCEYLSAECPVSINPAKCSANKECKAGFKCVDGKCLEACLGVICIATNRCVDGKCVPIILPKY